MKTKELIKEKARMQFNQQGIMNITLRQVASEAGKSYGNVTYHYKNKQELVMDLYKDMHHELLEIQPRFDREHLLHAVLEAPKITFSLSLKYAFLFSDYNELNRNFPEVAKQLSQDNKSRKSFYLKILKQLQKQQYLRNDLNDGQLDYLMDLSGMVRAYFFMSLQPDELNQVHLEERYVKMVNQLIFTYLSDAGIEIYNKWWQKSG